MSIFKRKFNYQGLVQFDEDNNPCICGCKVKWLDYVTVEKYTEKQAIKEACDLLNGKYPKYQGMVQLW